MSFRARLTLVAAAAVAFAVVLSSGAGYAIVRDQLRAEVDDALRDRAVEIQHAPYRRLEFPDPFLGGPAGYVQIVFADGTVQRPRGADIPIPVSERALDVATGGAEPFYTDETLGEAHARVLTFPAAPGVALQIARPLDEVDQTLDRLKTVLILIALAGIGLAMALGALVSRAAIAPVSRLTRATERVTETGDLSERIDARGQDELSRLAGSFNAMLGALEESTAAQRQLVADASHELRTPLTSLRTNIEVLASDRALPPDERGRLLSDVIEQLGEMTSLIAELIELARAEQQVVEPENVRLDVAAAEALERARRNHPAIQFESTLDESTVHGVPSTIERAIGNLLDNAAKWSPIGGQVELAVADGVVTVRDFGPGIAEEDLPYVFDRFYRARAARGMPGSGLGLAIVRQVAEAHGGEVVAERAAGGGTRMVLRLNGSPNGAGKRVLATS